MYFTDPPGADVKFTVITSVALLVAMIVISIHLYILSFAEDS